MKKETEGDKQTQEGGKGRQMQTRGLKLDRQEQEGRESEAKF